MIIGVLGGSGGVGASTFAAAVARAAPDGVLVDLDTSSGGIDVLLGIDEVAGARWSDLHLAGGHLDPRDLLDGLPADHGCPVLAADTAELDPGAVTQVLDVLASDDERIVVLDVPRGADQIRVAAVAACSLIVVLARADVAGLVGAHSIVGAVRRHDPPIGLVVRRGRVSSGRAAELVGAPLLGTLPRMRRTAPTRAVDRVVAGVLGGLAARPAVRPPR